MQGSPYRWLKKPLEGRFLHRLNRFACQVELDGVPTKVYLPNSGRLEELLRPRARVMLERRRDTGKTLHDLLLIETARFPSAKPIWAALDSRLPPLLLRWVLESGWFEEGSASAEIQLEPTIEEGRLDLLLTTGDGFHYFETKSVNLLDQQGVARFPDAPTSRGVRHLKSLIQLKSQGCRASMVFIVVRNDARALAPFEERDPEFAEALRTAKAVGVDILALAFNAGPTIQFSGPLPVNLEPNPFPGYWPVLPEDHEV